MWAKELHVTSYDSPNWYKAKIIKMCLIDKTLLIELNQIRSYIARVISVYKFADN